MDARPSAPIPYNSPRKLRPFLELAAERRIDLQQLLAAYGTTLEEMHHPDTRLPRPRLVAIMQALLAQLDDPLAGLRAAERFVLEDLDLLGYLAKQCANLLQALQSVVDCAPLIHDASRANLSRAGGAVILTQWLDGDPPQLPPLTDYMLASSHAGVSLLAGAPIDALRVELARPAVAREQQPAYRAFFGGPVVFGARRSALVYSEAALLRAIPSSDERLASLLRQQAEARLQEMERPASLPEQVRQKLRLQLRGGRPDPNGLARSLCMSGRTLRRRLAESGSSYRELLDEIRREEALRLMAAGQLAVGEAAERLGFEDASAFARAFRRWTGVSPSRAKSQARL